MCTLAITCPGLSEGVNTEALTANEIDGLSYLESYTYSCKEGYNTTDPLTTLCQPDGSLSLSTAPECTGKLMLCIIRNLLSDTCRSLLESVNKYLPAMYISTLILHHTCTQHSSNYQV